MTEIHVQMSHNIWMRFSTKKSPTKLHVVIRKILAKIDRLSTKKSPTKLGKLQMKEIYKM